VIKVSQLAIWLASQPPDRPVILADANTGEVFPLASWEDASYVPNTDAAGFLLVAGESHPAEVHCLVLRPADQRRIP
jgi:hypothetical protein